MPIIMKTTVDGQPKKIRLTDGTLYADLPIGFILPSFETVAPLGFLKLTDTLANRTVSRTTYKELFDWATERDLIGTGKPFGAGDGSTTFVIPDGKEIAFKGVGEYEGTVGNHVKSGGLAVGEFLDDRLQDHQHYESVNAAGADQVWGTIASSTGQTLGWYTGTVINARLGATTEVKSLGCHYYIKAKNVGVPADFVSEIDDVIGERLSYSTTEINTGKKSIGGKDVYSKSFVYSGATTAMTGISMGSIGSFEDVETINGSLKFSTGIVISLGYMNGDNNKVFEVSVDASGNVSAISPYSDSNSKIKVTVEYTKSS